MADCLSVTHDRRAVLESIAYGDDAGVRAADRLRAIEMLRELDAAEPDHQAPSELAELRDAELDRYLDALLAEEIAADVLGPGERWPTLAAALRVEIERRADERVRQAVARDVERRGEPPVATAAVPPTTTTRGGAAPDIAAAPQSTARPTRFGPPLKQPSRVVTTRAR